jgi:predicted small metal-binding protein
MVVNNATGEETEACPCNQFANFAFDSTSGGTENVLAQESNSMDRSVIVPRGSYTVKAQGAVTHSDVRFRVDDWSLTVEKARVS